MTQHAAPVSHPADGFLRRLRGLAAVAVLAVAVTACSGGTGASPTSAAPPDSAPPVASGEAPSGAPAEVPDAVIDNAIADAAERSGTDPAAAEVVVAEAHDWPNGGLGCPEPGMMYTEVITPGYRVVVEAGGTEYDYRASTKSSDVRWCENPPPAM